MHTDDSDPGGVVYWTRDGDKLEVCDIEADGYGVHSTIQWSYYYDHDYHNGYYLNETRGNGKCSYRDAADGGVYDIPEHTYVEVWVCLEKDGVNRTDTCDHSVWNN
ncbi:hypothetical protein ACWCQ1_50520 [Streptomyces sp. NPDC002144]